MASDINTKKTKKRDESRKPRWFRLAPVRADLPELDHLMDLYWGGPERRITGLTLRIIAVNAIALLILMLGILYLGQYQKGIINARLETFKTELELIAEGLAENTQANPQNKNTARIVLKEAQEMAARLAFKTEQRIQIFDTNGTLIIDTRTFPGLDDRIWSIQKRAENSLHSIEVLKSMAGFVLALLPDRNKLPTYPEPEQPIAQNFPDVPQALDRKISLSVWRNADKHIFLTAAAPILGYNNTLAGAVLLSREGNDIERDVELVWLDVLKIFIGTLILTTLLSIYLSGVIAQPLKKLAKAAEAVRKGEARADEIPDFSDRYDEIGDLSVVLRQMIAALWDRMDSIEQFAADVAHELKNPLTSLRSAVETALIVKTSEDRKKLMEIIRHDVDRLDRLISDISNASRLDSELSREAFEKIDLRKLLRNLLDLYAANPLDRQIAEDQYWEKTVQTEGATLRLTSPASLPIELWGLEGRLAQVFENLIANALSFTPGDKHISITVRPYGKKVHIHIEDEGPGIPPGKLETIFERFYSERPQHEGYGHHSGLGLSICKQIIEAHGGQIFAENIFDDHGNIRGARLNVILNRA